MLEQGRDVEKQPKHLAILAIDTSGSTAGERSYWARANEITRKVSQNPFFDEVLYLLWDTDAKEVLLEAVLNTICRKDGGGCTSLANACHLIR
jgi:hypothetical protein